MIRTYLLTSINFYKTTVLISNSEVKTLCADDSVGLPCESRSPPDSYTNPLFARADKGFFIALKLLRWPVLRCVDFFGKDL